MQIKAQTRPSARFLHRPTRSAAIFGIKDNLVHFSFSRGVDLRLEGSPAQEVTDKPITRAAISGADYPGLQPALSVAEGDRVRVGQLLFTDRAHSQVAFVSPLAGRIESIELGARRSLSSLVIRGETEASEDNKTGDLPDLATPNALRATLLSRGFWPAFRTRPFGRIPLHDAMPKAIFVTATDSEPLAPDPRVILATQESAFRRGTELLTLLCDGMVYVCQTPGPPLVEHSARIRLASFSGPHPSGLAGTHIHAIHPASSEAEIWSIDCQDVAAIGHLAESGRYDPSRIVALSGPGARRPRLLRIILGASIRELISDEGAADKPARVLSGSALAGREAVWLGRYHRQVTMLEVPARSTRNISSFLPVLSGKAGPRPIIPMKSLERALPAGFLPVPLIRALSVGDAEMAAKLGALELVEEDMALMTAFCTSGADYGVLLRQVLARLAEAA